MSNEEKPFGIDVSRWQGSINWDLIAINDPRVVFTAIRAGVSWGYEDSYFKRNWEETLRLNIPRCAYHVFFPGESPVRQMDKFLQIVGDDLGELPLTLDVELHHDIVPKLYQQNLLAALKYLEKKTGRKPVIYSRATFIDAYVTGTGMIPPVWYEDYDWWLAQYLRAAKEHPGPVTLPRGISRERVIIHQTSDKGKPIGVQSKVLDYNRWQFDLNHFYNYCGNQPANDPEPAEEDPTLEERVTALEEKVQVLEEMVLLR